jgi:hypothetical protein
MPTLAPPGNKYVYLGQTLSFTLQASDADSPSQLLAYNLAAGAPTNAIINLTNGLFTWTPLARQVPSTNLVTVCVTDNGIPPLSSRQSFLLIAGLPPELGAISADGDQLTLTWPTFAGRSYQVEYKEDMATDVWVPLSEALDGTGAPFTFTTDLHTSTQRFFRLRLVP